MHTNLQILSLRAQVAIGTARCRLAGALLGASAALLRASQRFHSAPTVISEQTMLPDPEDAPQSTPKLTVAELIESAERWNRPVFVLRVPGFTIRISRDNPVLEEAVQRSYDEGDPQPEGSREPFFASHPSYAEQ